MPFGANYTQSRLGQIGGLAATGAGLAVGGPAGAMLVQGGLGLASSFFDRPETPDYVSETRGAYANASRGLNRALSRQMDRESDEAAARGYTGSGGAAMRDAGVRRALDATAALEAQRADALAAAANATQQAEYGADASRYAAQVQGLGGLGQTAALYTALNGFGSESPGVSAPDPTPSTGQMAQGFEAVVPRPALAQVPGGIPTRTDPRYVLDPNVLAALGGPRTYY